MMYFIIPKKYECKLIQSFSRLTTTGRGGGGIIIIVLAYYSDDQSLNPTEVYSFSVQRYLTRTKKQKAHF